MKVPNLQFSRDSILFVAGLLGIGYETVAQGGERPTLLVVFGAMVGLPAFLRGDEKRVTRKEEPEHHNDEDPPENT